MASDAAKLVGVWTLRAFQSEDVETGARSDVFGANPRGVLMLHPDGRMVALLTPRDQKTPVTEADRAANYNDLVAYSGRYRLEPPDRFITMVDVAWTPAWLGTDQARTYRLDGDRLDVVSDPLRTPRTGDAWVRGILSWVREAPLPE